MSDTAEVPTVVTPPPAPPAPSSPLATVDHINGLHARLDRLEELVAEGFKELVRVVGKAGPIVQTAAAAVAKVVPGAGVAAAIAEKIAHVAETVIGCCGCPVSAHTQAGCQGCGNCNRTAAGARQAGAP